MLLVMPLQTRPTQTSPSALYPQPQVAQEIIHIRGPEHAVEARKLAQILFRKHQEIKQPQLMLLRVPKPTAQLVL